MITREFKLHLDASLYSFKFTGVNYATVKYSTDRVFKNITVEVFGIEMGPVLLCAITDREMLVIQAEAAARKNAVAYWKDQDRDVIKDIVKGFAPHI